MHKLTLILFLLFIFGCKTEKIYNNYETFNDDIDIYYSDSLGYVDFSKIVTVVTDNTSEIITFEELKTFERGTIMKLRVNREDFKIWEVDVIFDAVYQLGNERLILAHTLSVFPIGSGDSGSTLLTADGKIAGILCYGYNDNYNDFMARAVEDVISINSNQSNSVQSTNINNVLQPVYYASGFEENSVRRYPLLQKMYDNALIKSDYTPQKTLGKFSNQPIYQGSSIAINELTGDYLIYGVIGTLSYIDNDNYIAFGHEYANFLAAPTYLASNKSFIKAKWRSFKVAEPTNQLLGAMTLNHFNGILIENNVEPKTAYMITTCSVEGDTLFSYNHTLSNRHSIQDDNRYARNISSYLIWNRALYPNNLYNKPLDAEINIFVKSEKKEFSKTTTIQDDYYLDQELRNFLANSITFSSSGDRLIEFNVTMNIKYPL